MSAFRSSWTGIAVMMVVLALGLQTAQAAPSLWPANKGEVCLQNTSTGGVARLAVVRVLGGHYSVQGIVTDADEQITLVSGNAELVGNQVLIHVTASGYTAPEVHGMIGSVQLDASTLEGVFEGMGFHCDPGDDPDCGMQYEGVQTLVPVICPE